MARLVFYESDVDLGLVSLTTGPSIHADCEEFDCPFRTRANMNEERAEEKCWNVAMGHAHLTGHRVSVYRSQEWTLARRPDSEL